MDDFQDTCLDIKFVLPLVEAIALIAVADDMRLAFLEGVRVLSLIVEFGEKKNEKTVARVVKFFARRFYLSRNVDKIDWKKEKFEGPELMLIDAFPLFWQGGIDYMYPLLFRPVPIKSEFNQAIVARICQFRESRFLRYVHDHKILQEIEKMEPQPKRPDLNPHVFTLAKFIATGKYGKAPPKHFATPAEDMAEYDRFSYFIAAKWLPYRDLRAEEKLSLKEI
jgi:hypothetical protein